MIEVTAKLVRSPVYFAGQTVECIISFSNPPIPFHMRSQSNSDTFKDLAWASAQIHCHCTTNSKVALPESNSLSAEQASFFNRDTCFVPCREERGRIVFSTRPRILFCNVRLTTGENRSYLYSEDLPSDAPPSYRGQAVKYAYYITIAMQRVDCPIKLLRVPLRVLLTEGSPESSAFGDSENLTCSNPFLEIQQGETPLELGVQLLQNVMARRRACLYNIANSRGRVVRFWLIKRKYKLGEDIIGMFDFTEATVQCVQFSVILQSEEEIAPGFRRWTNQSSSVTNYSKHHEMSFCMRRSRLVLPIPMYVTPAFETELVSLKWRLHFEFVTTIAPSTCHFDECKGVWRAPSSSDVEITVWNLPMRIYPTTLVQVAHVLRRRLKYSMAI
ncbi:RAB6A-GEF complex partner protein 2 [Anabrus simplex]|uniref:RAB6A-GEF complex partner protein 2 n=1 Tax=Anabrus simplex TaxID=316456 RepID=UPI0035A2B2E8